MVYVMKVTVSASGDVAEFHRHTAAWLAADPVCNNVIATGLTSRADGTLPTEDDIVLLCVLDGGGSLAGVATRTPPHPMLITAMPPAAIAALADYVASQLPGVRAFNGPADDAHMLAQAVAANIGGSPQVRRAMARYRLDQVTAPSGVAGRARVATPADLDLVAGWRSGFQHDIGGHSDDNIAAVRGRLVSGQIWLWENTGQPVAMAAETAPAAGVARINLVYTPPPHRRRGYASALVAFLAQRILDSGNVPSLYADHANPTSNGIYQAIGFRKVDDAILWEITEP